MIDVGLVVGWLICSRLAYLVSVDAWLMTNDMTRAERRFHVFWSLGGPMTLAVGTLIWWGERPKSERSMEVVRRRKGSG